MAAPVMLSMRCLKNVIVSVNINPVLNVWNCQTLPSICNCHLQKVRRSSSVTNHHGDIKMVSSEDGDVVHLSQSLQEFNRGVGVTSGEQMWKVLSKPDQPPDSRLLQLSIIGRPNCGKSTLTNQLMGWRVSSVSNKVHTTRKRTTGIWTHNETQIVFLDTPGFIVPEKRHRHNLEKTLLTDPPESLESADIVAVVVDVSQTWNREAIDREILKVLHMHPTVPSILVLNKVDLVKNKHLLLKTVYRLSEGMVAGKEVAQPKKQKQTINLEEFLTTHIQDCERNSTENKKRQKTEEISVNNSEKKDFNDNLETLRSSVGCIQSEDFTLNQSSSSDKTHEYSMDKELTISQSKELVQGMDRSSETWVDLHQKLQDVRKQIKNKVGWSNFDHVFMVSALTGDGVSELKEYLLQCAKPSDWLYHSSLVTDQDPMEIAKMCVWEQLLENLRDEIPYNVDLDVVYWDVDVTGCLKIAVSVYCSKKRYIRAVLGQGGETVRKISIKAEEELAQTFKRDVFLKVMVKMRR